MAKIGFERWGLFKKHILEILSEHPEGMNVNELFPILEKRMPPTDFENGVYESDGITRRWPYVVRFSTIYAVKAGWLVKDQGHWTITDAGKQIVKQALSPIDLERKARDLYKKWDLDRPAEDDEEQSEEIELVASIEKVESDAISIVEKFLAQISPYGLQDLVAALLEGMGYFVSWVAPPGKDGGIDIIAFQDPLGASGPRIKVQVKRHNGRVSVDVIRSFVGLLSDPADIGIFVNIGGFTSDAESEARTQSSKRLKLLDSRALFDLWVKHYENIPSTKRGLMPIRPIFHLDLQSNR